MSRKAKVTFWEYLAAMVSTDSKPRKSSNARAKTRSACDSMVAPRVSKPRSWNTRGEGAMPSALSSAVSAATVWPAAQMAHTRVITPCTSSKCLPFRSALSYRNPVKISILTSWTWPPTLLTKIPPCPSTRPRCGMTIDLPAAILANLFFQSLAE